MLIKFHVFDAMHFDDWKAQVNTFSLTDRVQLVKELLDKMKSGAPVKQVEGKMVKDQEELLKFYSKTMEGGYEGIMIKKLQANYSFKRSDAVVKMKPVATYEGMIVGHYLGNRGSKREGLWGGFEVVMTNGIVTRVGGGYTDKLKSEIGINPDAWIGKIVEIEGQPDPMTLDGLTKDGKVRFPVFLRVRDLRDVDQKIVAAGEKYLKSIQEHEQV